MDYWALGGRAERTTLFNSPGIAHYPGTPQGRSPAEAGTHGCTLVNVDEQGRGTDDLRRHECHGVGA